MKRISTSDLVVAELYVAKGSRFIALLILFLMCFGQAGAQKFESINKLSFDFYSQENGLSNNQIHSILQDRRGWMWFGTSQGACRFDGYKFTAFKNDPDDSTSIKGNLVRVIYEDKKGQLWFGTENGGLNKFNREKEHFSHLFYSGENSLLRGVSVTSINEDKSGNLIVGTEQHLYLVKDEKTIAEIKPSNLSGFTEYFRVLRTDKSGKIWIGTNRGLYVYDERSNTANKINLTTDQSSNQEIWAISVDQDGSVWVGTYANGVFIVDSETFGQRHLEIDPANERSRTVRSIAKDKNGKYWIGTRGGLYTYDKINGVTGFYYHDEREPKSLVNNSVQCIYHDLKGDVWIGTRNGINFLVEERQSIFGYKAMPDDSRYLNSSEAYAFWEDPRGDIWVGTESGGLNILDRDSGRFRYLQPKKGDINSLSSNCIKALVYDGSDNLWIGTFLGGLDVLNIRTNKFTHYTHDANNPSSIADNKVWTILKDSKNQIWVGTSAGVDLFNRETKTFKHYTDLSDGQVNWIGEDDEHCLWICSDILVIYNPADQSIVKVNEPTRYMLQDSRKRFWLATFNAGIAQYVKGKGIVKYFNEKNGLSNNQTQAIVEDNEHFLWISTTNGLSKFDPENERFHNFSQKNGFENNQFCYASAYKMKNGELIFGGISGFNIFDPVKIKPGKFSAPVVLTDLKIFNKSVKIGDKKRDLLTKSISETEKIRLKYDQNSITLDFASFDFANSQSVQYSYVLEGFDKDWNEPSLNHSANYTNLDPGDYTFRVKTVSIDRQESNSGPELKIVVLPPYWKTWWFRLLMFAALVGLIYLFIAFLLNKEKLKNDLVLEKLKANKLHELDTMKLKFYTNISHEIRTPLTLILGPLEKMKNNLISPSDLKGHVEVMHRNAVQLLQLINQLLDFRKMETGNLKLNLAQGDLVSFLSETVASFEKLAEEKEIELKFNSLKKHIVTRFDAEKVGKMMNNLLSNAFKFTAKGGKVSVNLSLVFDSAEADLVGNSDEKRLVEITVRDTGIGIAESNLEKIFVRFFQIGENQNQTTGTGIGLALVKELVKLHNGKLFVTSKPGKGSKFTIQLPYEEVSATEKEVVVPTSPVSTEVQPENILKGTKSPDQISDEKKIMLLVDDNADVRYFIKTHFQETYQVLEAANGVEGWDLALKTIPDIIISDVLMPDLDGYEFCKRIRKDERTSHIPVLLVTALGSREHEIEGLSYGADDYITKPFDLVILQTKVENILSVRQSLKQKYTSEILLQPRNVILSSPDERFLQKAIDVIEANISDPDLDIERFATEIGVSRMQLYRKLNALTEMTVKEFVRSIRLKRAAQLLVQRKLNISEVAYAVGFRDLSHFRKCFRQEFGMNASEYVEKHGE
ncbi:MAG TPA: two-component regulator propeller domain-containing protein [Prolixibacteraceae bacterium]|nr:two-component regulator propeller domain-containing protein [Prolixibacteraceae bacterium]